MAEKRKSRIVRLAAALALVTPFVLLPLLAGELWLRRYPQVLTGNFSCLAFNDHEGATFLPKCRAEPFSPNGTFRFETNEDGFRDRPRSFFAGGAVAFLGDSHVEGLYLEPEQTLARALEDRIHVPVLNLGLRGTGPTLQAIRLYRARHTYPIRGAIWLLNPTDPADEIYFYQENPTFLLDQPDQRVRHHVGAYSAWRGISWLSSALHHKLLILLYVIDHFRIEADVRRAVETVKFDPQVHCRALRKVASDFRRDHLPLVFLIFPHGAPADHLTYFGVEPDPAQFRSMLDCAAATGFPVVNATDLAGHKEYYWSGDWHLNADGVRAYADRYAPEIEAGLRRARP